MMWAWFRSFHGLGLEDAHVPTLWLLLWCEDFTNKSIMQFQNIPSGLKESSVSQTAPDPSFLHEYARRTLSESF